MKIKVRLFATLREGREKELCIDLPEPVTAKNIIDHLEVQGEDVAILLINGRNGSLAQVLTLKDVVSIFPPVGGG